ncbi:MAG: hypothetical protein D6722_00200 [Bacteroidetes bacterium]|nr:MAG: hypothetical protein D6722_00200 [Bacteroidota bacterium]
MEDIVLESVRNDVAQVGADLKLIAERVIDEGISDYPVFVVTQEPVDFGRMIFDRDEISLNWFFQATILEDFVKRDLVTREHLGEFQAAFDDPRERACIFVLTPEVQQFVFLPYDIA